MKYSSKELKTLARTQLTGKYGTFIGAYVIYFLISSAVSFVLNLLMPGVSYFLASVWTNAAHLTVPVSQLIIYLIVYFIISLILSIFMLGFNKMFLDGSRGYPVRLNDILYGFRHHPDRVILMQLLLQLIIFACMAPSYAFFIAGLSSSSLSDAYMGIGFLLAITGAVIGIYFSILYSQGMFLLADYDDLGPIQALKESRRLIAGSKGRYFYLQLSFIGISLLCVLTCYIGFLWALPYMMMTQTNFYRNLDNEI